MRTVLGWEHPVRIGDSVPAMEDRVRLRSQTEAWIDACGEATYWVGLRPFRRERPCSEEDAAQGRICARSGFWYPASRLAEDRGLIVGYDQVRGDPHDG